MVIGPVAAVTGFEESVTRMTGVLVPAMVGVPVTAQPAPKARPAGNDPETMPQVYGAVPPAAPTVELYGVPTVPFGSCEVVIATVAPAVVMVMLSVTEAVAFVASCTRAVKVETPVAVGVPEITPAVDRVRPAGREPDEIVHV